ncbi:MAG: glutamate racemase [Chitinispirillales bacterium]|jgi:glutamate racemase|nr:glutamate racemase [Chitinispirillales bacterium]
MSDCRPIGVFDSGVGGLTVLSELSKILPDEQIIYLGDTLRCPYGDRSVETIRKFSVELTKFLLTHNVKMVIAACNTVSAAALDCVKESAGEIPVIGVVEPGCRAAVQNSTSKKIGVIGTRATISAGAYGKGIRKINQEIIVYEKACPLLVHLVEEGEIDSRITDEVLKKYLSELLDLGIDSLVLGCTHYPLLYNSVVRCAGKNVSVINGAKLVAEEAKKILEKNNLLSAKRIGEDILFATDITPQFERLTAAFLMGAKKNICETSLLGNLPNKYLN